MDRHERRSRRLDCRAAYQGHDKEEGFNAQTERYESLVQAGVIDPTKVVHSALQDACFDLHHSCSRRRPSSL
jgi:hypothetical protein